jgi:flagellar biogenesis protein FliO
VIELKVLDKSIMNIATLSLLLTVFFILPSFPADATDTLNVNMAPENHLSSDPADLGKGKAEIGTSLIDKKQILAKFKIIILFLAGIGAVAYLLKKKGFPSSNFQQSQSIIETIEEKNFCQGISLVLVRIREKEILLSKYGGKLELLATITEKNNTEQKKLFPILKTPISMHDVHELLLDERHHANI